MSHLSKQENSPHPSSEAPPPLVSMVIVCYNQKDGVGKAIQAALAQTYSPLEIILSDDYSTDNTFEEFEKFTKNYKGPHRIITNRNKTNLGTAAHLGNAVSRAQGKFIVVAAGDDCSSPDRVQHLTNQWLNSNQQSKIILSDELLINSDGSTSPSKIAPPPPSDTPLMDMINRQKSNPRLSITGAVAAYDISLFKNFAPFIKGVINEDRALLFRCYLLKGNIEYIDKPLVLRHTAARARQINQINKLRWKTKISEQMWLDLKETPNTPDKENLLKTGETKLIKYKIRLSLAEKKISFRKCAYLCQGTPRLWPWALITWFTHQISSKS